MLLFLSKYKKYMIQFDNLSLSYDNKNLYISASIIEDDDNFDVFLD